MIADCALYRFFLLLLLLVVAVDAALKMEHRQVALRTHNRFRRDLANGLVENKNGSPLPKAKNMYEFKYRLALERIAEKSARKCQFKHSKPADRNYTFTKPVDVAEVLDNATAYWWQELSDFGIDESLNLTQSEFDKGIGHFTQMAWSETTSIGCAVRYCKKKSGAFKWTIVFCNYSPPGNILNKEIYQVGRPCKSDDDCDRYENSKCIKNRGLCRRS